MTRKLYTLWPIQHRRVVIAEPACTTVGKVRGILCRMCELSASTTWPGTDKARVRPLVTAAAEASR
jgi:hypothetical protein